MGNKRKRTRQLQLRFMVARANLTPYLHMEHVRRPLDMKLIQAIMEILNFDGLRVSATYKWPGPVHEGNGEYQIFIDEKATSEQRDAIEKIVTGEDTEEMATMWWIFNAMCPTSSY